MGQYLCTGFIHTAHTSNILFADNVSVQLSQFIHEQLVNGLGEAYATESKLHFNCVRMLYQVMKCVLILNESEVANFKLPSAFRITG